MQINRAVYRLWHDGSERGRVGYIGKDKYHPSRMRLEMRAQDPTSPQLYKALQKYNISSWKTEVLESGFESDEALNTAEKAYIAKFKANGDGYNCTDGGDGLLNASKETRQKISSSMIGEKNHFYGKKHSPEALEKIGRVSRGRTLSEAWRNKIGLSSKGRKYNTGRKHSVESRAKISAALIGNKYTLGHTLSQEHKDKMSKALKGKGLGRKVSEETKDKIRKAHIGKKHSPEHCARIREGRLKGRTNASNSPINIPTTGPACPDSTASTI